MSSDDNLKNILRKIFKQLSDGFEPPILFAYIFGSLGTAGQNEQSDLDIAVYLDLKNRDFEMDHKLRLYTEISRAAKRNDIDLVILNVCKNDMLLYEVMTKGEVIFDAAPETRALFEQGSLHSAIDFKQHREKMFS